MDKTREKMRKRTRSVRRCSISDVGTAADAADIIAMNEFVDRLISAAESKQRQIKRTRMGDCPNDSQQTDNQPDKRGMEG